MANLVLKTKTRYGIQFPVETDEIFVHLTLAKKWMLKPYCYGNLLDPGEHMLRAIRALFTPEQWKINPWVEQQVHSWSSENFMVWLGAASTGKSNTAGGLAVLDWITDPTETYIALASTSVPMLRLRSFESVIRYFRHLKKHPRFLIPGKEAPSQTAIINDNDADDGNDTTAKASIRGVALADGDEAKAVARLAGSHLPFTTMILDEGSALPEAAAKARFNAAAGTRRFRFVSLANPVSWHDEASKFSIPVDGLDSITEETPSWRSRFGLVLHHNGFLSPAITEPGGAEAYPFLINQAQIDRMLVETGGNTNDPMIFMMVKGFPSPMGSESTVLTEADIRSFSMKEPVEWHDDAYMVRVAGLDPAFTSGGDGCILQRATIGMSKQRVSTILFEPPDIISIDASSTRPATYQVTDATRNLLHQYGIPVSNLAVDDSGTQSVADVIEVELGARPIRCNFASKASDNPIGSSGILAKSRFRNQVTEIWFLLAALGREGRLRGMCDKVAEQFCSRRFLRDRVPLALESKADYKKRRSGSRSPDEGDAAALACLAAKAVAGFTPGVATPQGMPRREGEPGFQRQKKLSVGYTNSLDNARYKSYIGNS